MAEKPPESWTFIGVNDSAYVKGFYLNTVNIDFRLIPDGYEHLRGSREACEVKVFQIKRA